MQELHIFSLGELLRLVGGVWISLVDLSWLSQEHLRRYLVVAEVDKFL